jgi:hypothetical protein
MIGHRRNIFKIMDNPWKVRLQKHKERFPAAYGYGIDLKDIYKIGLSQNVIDDIMMCLKSEDVSDISEGFYFLTGFLRKYSLKNFGNPFVTFLINRVPELLNHKEKIIHYKALDYFVMLRSHYPNYREKMLTYLSDDDLGYRQIALLVYETYCKSKEIEPLLKFKNDDYASEISMNSYLVYKLRNLALKKIERLSGKNFRKYEKVEPREGTLVYWNDWEPFLEWWANQQ